MAIIEPRNGREVTTAKNRPAAVIPERAKPFIAASRSKNTVKAYQGAWAAFCAYCDERKAQSRPASPATVADYITTLAEAGHRPATIAVHLAAISSAHRIGDLIDPTRDEAVRLLAKGIRRSLGTAPAQKAPALRDDIKRMVAAIKPDLFGVRDRALILLGFAGAFRRSELVGLDVADLRWTDDGLVITLRRSKTDQEGAGTLKHVPTLADQRTCPVAALRRWLAEAEIQAGPVFRRIDRWANVSRQRLSDHAVARIIKQAARAAGLEASQYSGHSLRAGLVTQASQDGVDALGIQEVTGHKSMDTIIKYQRSAGRRARDTVRKAFGE